MMKLEVMSQCPICSKETLPRDASTASRDGKITILEGQVNCVVHPGEAAFTPFGDYCTIPLYLKRKRTRVHYLKFKTSQEMDRLGLQRHDIIQVEGCLHDVDGYHLVFAITDCRLLSRPEERGVDERILAAHWWTTMPPPALVIGMVAARNKMSPSEYCVYIGAVPRSANEPKDCEWIADRGARVARDHAIAVLPELVGIEEREGLEYREGK